MKFLLWNPLGDEDEGSFEQMSEGEDEGCLFLMSDDEARTMEP